jgi:hypothetical protein
MEGSGDVSRQNPTFVSAITTTSTNLVKLRDGFAIGKKGEKRRYAATKVVKLSKKLSMASARAARGAQKPSGGTGVAAVAFVTSPITRSTSTATVLVPVPVPALVPVPQVNWPEKHGLLRLKHLKAMKLAHQKDRRASATITKLKSQIKVAAIEPKIGFNSSLRMDIPSLEEVQLSNAKNCGTTVITNPTELEQASVLGIFVTEKVAAGLRPDLKSGSKASLQNTTAVMDSMMRM